MWGPFRLNDTWGSRERNFLTHACPVRHHHLQPPQRETVTFRGFPGIQKFGGAARKRLYPRHGYTGTAQSLSFDWTKHYSWFSSFAATSSLGVKGNEGASPFTYVFGSCFFQKSKVMHFQNGDIKLYTVVLLFLCFLKILTKLCCRLSWSRRSTVNNCCVREFQIPDCRAQ